MSRIPIAEIIRRMHLAASDAPLESHLEWRADQLLALINSHREIERRMDAAEASLKTALRPRRALRPHQGRLFPVETASPH